MKVYFAARYSMRKYLVAKTRELEDLGHRCCSSWLLTQWDSNPDGPTNAPPEYREELAKVDLTDVAESDIVVGFNCEGKGRGGRHVEFGLGLGLFKCCVWIGEPENIFHFHPRVIRFDTWQDFIDHLPNNTTCVTSAFSISQLLRIGDE
jgi:hypothetical protein